MLEFILGTMPYFWLVGFIVFLLISYYYLKHTKTGYRYEFAKVVALNLSLTFLCGCILYSLGAGKRFEDAFAERAPFYHDWREHQREMWQRPERGVIVGRVISIDEEGNLFELDDPRRDTWTVDASHAGYAFGFVLQEGYMVKVFGIASGDHYFTAVEVRPWEREREPRLPFLPDPEE
jgi:hypothetical protein